MWWEMGAQGHVWRGWWQKNWEASYQIQSLLLQPPHTSSFFNPAELPPSYLLHRLVIWDQVEVKSCICSTELLEDQHQGVHRERI